MTIGEFKTISPGDQFILFYHTNSTVKAINISVQAANGINTSLSLQQLTSVVVTVNNTQYTLTVVGAPESYQGYYHYRVEDAIIPIGDLITPPNVTFLYPNLQDANFNNSEYDVLMNNASTNRTIGFIFDVDRSDKNIAPLNYQGIISGSANQAEFQELNYTSVGITNSRYKGSKTSITDYGVSSALGVKVFSGASYLTSVEDNYICSQSLSDRILNEFVYTGNLDFPASGSRVFILEGSRALPVRNRKIWVRDNTRVFQVDNNGYTSTSGSLCSI